MADDAAPETVDVWVVWAYDKAADGPDLSRINTVQSVSPDEARNMIRDGEARRLDDPRNVDDGYRPDPVDDPTVDLSSLTRDELRERLPDGVELPASAKKADLLAAVEKAHDVKPVDGLDGVESSESNTGAE